MRGVRSAWKQPVALAGHAQRAARAEAAAGHAGQRLQARHLVRQHVQAAPAARRRRVGQLQAARVGMPGLREQRPRRPTLHHLAGVQHRHLVADLAGQPQVVGDEDQRGAGARLQFSDQSHDARLHRHVERGGRLVGHHQPRAAGEGERDQHPLAHAAGQLVRILGQQVGALAQMHRLEHRQRPVAPRPAGGKPQPGQMLVELAADAAGRVERGQRLLRHEGDLAAQQRAAAGGGQAEQILAGEGEAAGADREAGRQRVADDTPDHRLAGAGFPHQPEDAARRQRERQLLDQRRRHAADGGAHRQPVGAQDGRVRCHGIRSAVRPASAAGRRRAG